jgi:hypothetical protein
MTELVLNMPINPAIGCVQFDETIVAKSLIMFALTDLVPIAKKVLISEIGGKEELRDCRHFPF